MQNQPRPSWLRSILLPYSGEELLTRRQSWRIIITWALSFALVITIAIIPVVVALHVSALQTLVRIFLLTFLFAAILFGLTAWLVVAVINRSVIARQEWKAQHAAGSKQH